MPTLTLTTAPQKIEISAGSYLAISNSGPSLLYVSATNSADPAASLYPEGLTPESSRLLPVPEGGLYAFGSAAGSAQYAVRPILAGPYGGSSAPSLPAGLQSGQVWAEIDRRLALVEAAGSDLSYLDVGVGDSKKEGHKLDDLDRQNPVYFLALHFQDKGRPGGIRKRVTFDRLAASGVNSTLSGTAFWGDGVSSGTEIQNSCVKVPSGGTYAKWYPDGLTAATIILDPQGDQGTLTVDVYSGRRDGKPGSSPIPANTVRGDLATWNTGGQFVADWAKTDFSNDPSRLHRDAQGVPFGTNRRTYIPVAAAMPLTNQGDGCTVVIRPGNTEQYVFGIVGQRGGSARNYIGALNVAEHGTRADAYFDPTPRAGYDSTTEGQWKLLVDVLRNRRDYQAAAWSATTHAASFVTCRWARYTNDFTKCLSDPDPVASVDALLAGLAGVRDYLVARDVAMVFELLPVTGNQEGALWERFKAGYKALATGHPLSGLNDIQAVAGQTRTDQVANYDTKGHGGDTLHEGAAMNAVTAAYAARSELATRWAR